MIVKSFAPLEGERVAAVQPPIGAEVLGAWRRRLRLFTGRALTAPALTQEQRARLGNLTTAGQRVSPGVVDGLHAVLSAEAGRLVLHLTSGLGVARTGEVVVVPATTKLEAAGIPGLGNVRGQFGVLVLEPVEVRLPGVEDPGDQCDYDPATDAFMDWQLLDACQLKFIPWTDSMPKLPADERLRNLAAYAVFAKESQLGPDELLPWEEQGVPIALMATDDNGAVRFLDRYAVVRDGGRPRRRTDLIAAAGHPVLWQARLLQFSEQISQTTSPAEAARAIAILPPAGLLPAEWFRITFSAATGLELTQPQPFFAPHLELSARAVPLEQLDALLEQSASFDPVSLAGFAQLELLIPVPQVHFEPELLSAERVDPEFQEALRASLLQRADSLGRRALLRASLNRISRAMSGKDRDFPLSDPNRIDAVEDVSANPAADVRDTPVDLAALETDLVAQLEKAFLAILKDANLASQRAKEFVKMGLLAAIERLDAMAERGDDVIDVGFLRAQTDMYRLRQLLLAGTTTSRLATSPALAGIAEATTAIAREEAINKVISEMKANKDAQVLQRTIRSTRAPTGSDFQIRIQDLDREMLPAEGEGPVFGDREPSVMAVQDTAALRATATRVTLRRAAAVTPAARAGLTGGAAAAAAGGLFVERAPRLDVIVDRPLPPPPPPPPKKEEPVVAEPVVGRQDIRASGTASRLNLAKGPEARDFALSTKYAVVNALKNPIDAGAPADGFGLPDVFASTLVPGLGAFENNAFVFEKVNGVDANLRRQNRLLKDLDQNAIARILQEPDDKNLTDEAGHFAAAVDLVESAIATLRGAEFFVEGLRQAAAICRAGAGKYLEAAERFEERLAVIEEQIGEARQDVAVVRALLAEEQQRVDLINARRARILREHVPVIAFRRPSAFSNLEPVVTRRLDPEPAAPVVPACLSRNLTPPEELQKMTELLRESPVRWFPRIEALLDRVERRDQFDAILRVAQRRLVANVSVVHREAEFVQVSKGRFEAPLARVLASQRNRTIANRAFLAAVQLPGLAGLPWSEGRRTSREALSIGDLIEGARPQLARVAASELDQISRVSACLHEKFAEVPPEVRLDWALRYSQFDEGVDLRHLAVLPGWQEVDFLDRHELQSFTDWLFAQVDTRDTDALETVNNIVRTALLLASHAPVNRLLQGAIDEARDVAEGGAATAVFDDPHLPYLKRGLQLHLLRGGIVIAHAVIDDLLDRRAQIRVVKNLTPDPVLKLGPDTQVQSPAAGSNAERQLKLGGLTRTAAVLAAATGKRKR